MNIHHLELFYYVAEFGGISRAVRHMPYGIQQPAVSSQILQLEQDLGVKLFDRQPFQLTPEGEDLFAFIKPFFENLEPMRAKLQRGRAPQLRIGASEWLLRNHLPPVWQRLQKQHPQLQLALRTGLQPQMEAWLKERQIDLAVVSLENRPASRLHAAPLLRLPLVLLVNKESKIKSAEQVWAQDRIAEPLISLPATEALSRLFQKGLRKLKVDWSPALETSSYESITWFVANRYGMGINVNLPEIVAHPQVRALPLPGFEPVEVVVMWSGQPTAFLQSVLEEIQAYARQIQSKLGAREAP
jgi:DNA-binding transcriptional LysR family regulator